MDYLRHPDLVEVGHSLRATHDAVLAASQLAAHIAHRRTRTLRDLLLEAEDRGDEIVVHTASGPVRGRVSVGDDVAVIAERTVIALHAIHRLDLP